MYDFTLTGLFNSKVETVYNAFNDPSILVKWFAPGNLVVAQYIGDYTKGGNYRAVLQSPDGFQQTIVGTFNSIIPNTHLSFTWRWDDTNDITKVNVMFAAMPNSSARIVLTQSGFDQEQDMLQQQSSWLACLEKLSLATWDASQNSLRLSA